MAYRKYRIAASARASRIFFYLRLEDWIFAARIAAWVDAAMR